MAPPTRDGEGRCPDNAQRPQPVKKNLEHPQNTQQRQRLATTPVARIAARTGKACDTWIEEQTGGGMTA
jgi:hypothetical protein